MALVALRRLSLGDGVYDPGDPIPAEVQVALPPGRVEALRSQRYVEERGSEVELAEELANVRGQLEDALARIGKLEAQAKPKPQRKKEASA